MIRADAGDVVAWWDGPSLAIGVVRSVDGGRLTVVRSDGAEVRATPARVALLLEEGAGAPPRSDAAAKAAAFDRRVRAAAAQVDVEVLWDLEHGAAAPLADFAEVALGDRGPEARAAVVLALATDGVRFVRRGEEWEPRSAGAVAQLMHEREVAERRVAELGEARDALRAAVSLGTPFPASPGEPLRRYLDALETVALEDLDADTAARDLAVEALAAAQLRYDTPAEGAFRLLRAAGRFASDDENLAVRRFRLRTTFPDAVLTGARSAAEAGPETIDREDLRGVPFLAIDSAGTKEVDDALAVEDLGDRGWRVVIAIADPGSFVARGDAVDLEAEARGLTYYFPDSRLNMLPPSLAEDAASLVPGERRPALVFSSEVRRDGRVGPWRVVLAAVQVLSRVTYDGADQAIAAGSGPHATPLLALDAAAEALERARSAAGALRMLAPEVEIKVADGRMTLERTAAGSRSRRLVTEAMVLAGALAARWCIERGVPAFFRRQAPPDRGFDLTGRVVEDPLELRDVRRLLRRGETSVVPATHFALGLEAYSQVTSPLRRFQDLVMHRQMRAALRGEPPPYDTDALRRILASTDRAEADARRAERQAATYWFHRYLESQVGLEVAATVVEAEPRPIVLLDDTLLEFPVPALLGSRRGDRVVLRVERVVPRAGIVRLRPA